LLQSELAEFDPAIILSTSGDRTMAIEDGYSASAFEIANGIIKHMWFDDGEDARILRVQTTWEYMGTCPREESSIPLWFDKFWYRQTGVRLVPYINPESHAYDCFHSRWENRMCRAIGPGMRALDRANKLDELNLPGLAVSGFGSHVLTWVNSWSDEKKREHGLPADTAYLETAYIGDFEIDG